MFERGDTVSWQTTSSRRLFGIVYDIDSTIGVKPLGSKDVIYIQAEFLKLEERPGRHKIIEIESAELTHLLGEAFGISPATLANFEFPIRKLRVTIQGNRVMFKTNERMWTALVGHLDPMCQLAQYRASVDPRAENEPLTSTYELTPREQRIEKQLKAHDAIYGHGD